ncbi:MAG: Rne/Rng family ribonuclease [Desulfomonile tiedjei]|uniref:Ribonuclease G n=1 Tax=Desulfomonile tiedjei TaxID=2358 RepID=A0A9D6UZF6_9BACT|nr:Rne/Rng family ribonuclease [Desulfomonile tiedjei]
MANEIVMNITKRESRLALVENGQVAELHLERKGERGIVGNIYKGRVIKVLPGMQAAFVDIGLPRAAFLYVGDIHHHVHDLDFMVNGEEHEEHEEGEDSIPEGISDQIPSYTPIEDLIQEGEDILVQISKEPLGSKGARITSHISIPGRHLVFMPTVDHVGISRRIENEIERQRLKDVISQIKPNSCGIIVRTVSEHESQEKLQADLVFLQGSWERILEKEKRVPAPYLIYEDMDLCLRGVRDLFTENVSRLVLDSREHYYKILEFIDTFMPALKPHVELYEGDEPIFDYFGIEMELNKALGRKVWLKSGGYINIDFTEALVAIDVNTGRFVGKRNLQETILKTNLEAAREIAYQLRLRNIGGIIIVDFIDMDRPTDRDKVFNALQEALRKDKQKTNILKISELGLVQMTRKRTRESLTRTLCEQCPYCEGKGFLKSQMTVCYEILRGIARELADEYSECLRVTANPEVLKLLFEQENNQLEEIQRKHNTKIVLNPDPNMVQEQYEITNC